ncbi:hypothetical protein JOQ06_013510, partial [Pogonophryne albipinna]
MLSHEERWRQMRRQGAVCEMNGVKGDDDGDRTFEEESRRRNQDALSASNGLALDLRAFTSQFNCERGGVMKGQEEKLFEVGTFGSVGSKCDKKAP